MVSAANQGGFDTLITIIFIFVALILLFPLNVLIPVDRRLGSMIGAVLCMMIIYAFPYQRDTNIGAKVDFGVLIILAAIMAINFVLLRQQWVKAMTDKIQIMIREDVNRGFWAVSIIAMVASPFITNDGLCLMLVHPVLDAFKRPDKPSDETGNNNANSEDDKNQSGKAILGAEDKFCQADPFYFMLTIACSSNTGSAMTYTGNPQNIIVASYLSKYMNGGAFFALMVIPSLIAWGITAYTINQYRKVAAAQCRQAQLSTRLGDQPMFGNMAEEETDEVAHSPLRTRVGGEYSNDIELQSTDNMQGSLRDGTELDGSVMSSFPTHHKGKDGWDVVSAPYIVLLSIILIMALEFSGSVPLVGLFAFVSVVMVTGVIMYNYYGANSHLLVGLCKFELAPQQCWRQLQSSPDNVDRRLIIKDFIEELFHDIDYNLLIIFIGLFIVSGSFLLTNIPQTIWTGIAGNSAFTTVGSTVSICVYIVLACQLIGESFCNIIITDPLSFPYLTPSSLGNVPVVFMAEDNVSDLSRNAQIFGWLILAFVSTVAGNFTLVGSAANIIVAEKAMRYHLNCFCPNLLLHT